MARRNLQFGFALLAPALLVTMLAAGSWASTQREPKAVPAPVRPRPGLNNPKPGERKMLDLPPAWTARVRQMSPEQQQKFLSNNERFRELPPQRQAQIRQQLQRWNGLSPDQRQTLLNREQVWDSLTTDQKSYVRDTLLPHWQSTPPARRQVILGKLRQLRGLDDAQRTAKLNNESFLGGMHPEDRQMLRDLSNLRVGPEEPPGEP